MDTNSRNEFFNPKGIRKLENGNYEVGSLYFFTKGLALYKPDGDEIDLDYQQAVLLKMFLEAAMHFLSREEIIDALWPDEPCNDTVYQNRLNMSVKRLREALSADRNIEIICKTKKGYKLRVNGMAPGK